MTHPTITAFLEATGQTTLTLPDGETHHKAFPDVQAARRAIREAAAKEASTRGTTVKLEITEPSGLHALLIDQDGDTELVGGDLPTSQLPPEQPSRFAPAPTPIPETVVEDPDSGDTAPRPILETSPVQETATAAPAPVIDQIPAMPAAPVTRPTAVPVPMIEDLVTDPSVGYAPVAPMPSAEDVAPVQGGALPTRKSLRDADPKSFVKANVPVEPASEGWRGVLNSIIPSLGLAPSEGELQEREWIRLVAKHYATTRTVAIINQKGGVGKTPATVCLAATLGRSGGSVLAWDNNETSGSLGDRTDQGDHESSALNVLERSDHLLSDAARAADINAFVHRQITDKYDVLRSDTDLVGTHEITAAEVDTLHAVASKFFNVLLMDSGNNHRASNWNRMIDYADQLVLPVSVNEDDVHKGLLTLKGLALRSEETAALAGNAVVVVSQKASGQSKEAQRTASEFAAYVREVVVIPYDPALVSGVIRFGALQPATRLAWLKAAAAVARGL